MTFFAKLTVAVVTVTIGGGGTALGIYSKLQNTTTSFSDITLLQEETNLGLGSGAQITSGHFENILQQDEQASRTQVTEETSPLSNPAGVEKLQSEPHQIKVTQNLSGEGNCVVEDGWEEKVIAHLPRETQYISVFCKNTGGSDASLTNWRGFLPKELFGDNTNLLVKGVKFDIVAKDIEVQNLEEDTDTRAVFSSKQFVDSSIIGKWGNKIVDGIPSGVDSVYEVELISSTTTNKFYLQWL